MGHLPEHYVSKYNLKYPQKSSYHLYIKHLSKQNKNHTYLPSNK